MSLTTDLGACEWFVWDLRRSNLIDRGQLDQVIGEFLSKNPGAEPPSLAEFLVGQGILTDFQAERLLQGKTQGFVLGPFTLMDALGTGSMGTVYKAQSKNDNRSYAVKVLPRRSMWNVRIARRKVRLFEQCQHPSRGAFRGRRHGRRHALPGLAARRRQNPRQDRRGKGQAQPRADSHLRPADRRGARAGPSAEFVPRTAQALQPDDQPRGAGRASSISASAVCWPRPRANRWSIRCPRPTRSTAAWTAPAPKASWTRPT